VTKAEKFEVLNACFASVVNTKASCSADTQPPELEDRNWKQSEAPINQREVVSDLLHHLDIHKAVGLWGCMGSTQGYCGSWWKCSPSHFQSLIGSSD